MAKYSTESSTMMVQPFAYRFVDILPEPSGQSSQAGNFAIVLLLLMLILIFAMLGCKLKRQGGAIPEVVERVLSAVQIKRSSRPGK